MTAREEYMSKFENGFVPKKEGTVYTIKRNPAWDDGGYRASIEGTPEAEAYDAAIAFYMERNDRFWREKIEGSRDE